MCFDAAQIAKSIQKGLDAMQYFSNATISKKIVQLPVQDYYHVSGFSHPELMVIHRQETSLDVDLFRWGLIPSWANNIDKAIEISNKTLNARGESIFEKVSFRDAAIHGRAIIPLSGFYEHQHHGPEKRPHFIYAAEQSPLLVAGLVSFWYDSQHAKTIKSCSIVTRKANDMMSEIHNNPKLSEPRMPLILQEDQLDIWLTGDEKEAKALVSAQTELNLKHHTVRKLKGKQALGNLPAVMAPYEYPDNNLLTLFN